jgi:hypothetical protein
LSASPASHRPIVDAEAVTWQRAANSRASSGQLHRDSGIRRSPARRPGRRALVSGKKKMNTIKFTKVCDERGRTLRDGTFRPGRQHDQTALKTDGTDGLPDQFPGVKAEMDAGYRGLHRDHSGQISVPPKKPARDAPPEVIKACEQARHDQSSQRICVEHAIADSKNWRSLQR